MRYVLKIATWLLFAAPIVANTQPIPVGKPFSQANLQAFLKALNTNRQLALYAGPDVPCTIGVQCDVTLTPQELFDTNNHLVACAIQVGEVQIDVGVNPRINKKTVIHWTIGSPAAHNPPTNAVYTFETRGLIIFKDDDDATLKKADSNSDANDLYLTHRFKRRNAEVIYYPVVFQRIGSNPPALCGSADPRILND